MATIDINLQAQGNARQQLNSVKQSVVELNREISDNRQKLAEATGAERDNINEKIRAARLSKESLGVTRQELTLKISALRDEEREFKATAREKERIRREEEAAAKRAAANAVREFRQSQRRIRQELRDALTFRKRQIREQRRLEQQAIRERERLYRGFTRTVQRIGQTAAFGGLFLGGGLVAASRGFVDAAIQIETVTNSMKALGLSTQEANRELSRLRELADLPGITFEGAAKAAVDLRAVGIEGARARDLST